jgi:hypothetical protein
MVLYETYLMRFRQWPQNSSGMTNSMNKTFFPRVLQETKVKTGEDAYKVVLELPWV